MKTIRRITIAQHERGLKFRNRSFETILDPGVHWLFDPLGRTEVQVCDLTVPEFEHPRAEFLVKEARERIERHLEIVEIGDREVGVVRKQGRIAGILAPNENKSDLFSSRVEKRVVRRRQRLRASIVLNLLIST